LGTVVEAAVLPAFAVPVTVIVPLLLTVAEASPPTALWYTPFSASALADALPVPVAAAFATTLMAPVLVSRAVALPAAGTTVVVVSPPSVVLTTTVVPTPAACAYCETPVPA